MACRLLWSAFLLFEIASAPLMFAQNSAKTAPSPITVSVDASEAPRKIFHARLTIPATPGRLTLLYPKWIPGEHGPTGPIVDLAGLKFSAGGKTLPWRRDLLDMYTFHLDVPAGANVVEVSLDYLSPALAEGFSSGASATANLAIISWNQLLLYPQGWSSDQLTYTANLRIPAGWKYGTALPGPQQSGETIQFSPASLTTLVDSPVLLGRYMRVVPLNPGGTPPHEMDIAADSAAALEMPADIETHYKQLVAETGALFGARHYGDYHFLFTLSDYVAHFGLEHHESNDSRIGERGLVDDDQRKISASLLTHEFTHSWNGKYRRPADLATADYQQPMQTELLWVYEGLTSYLGNMLAARTGLWNPDQYRDALALIAADLDHRPGRTWRPLADTAVDAQVLYNAPVQWSSWRRSTDFYDEDVLVWLEADVIIRQRTQGRRSLDDFCKLFHGGQNTPPKVVTYTFDDVVAALGQIANYDWKNFFTTRLNSLSPRAPVGGVEGGGWRLIYNDVRPELLKSREEVNKYVDASFSLGLLIKEDGSVSDAIFSMPAASAGIAPGMKVIAVNGRRFSPTVLRDALKAGKNSSAPLELLVENGEFFKTYPIDYHGGEKYPHLERDSGRPDLLGDIIRPHASGTPR